MCNSSPTHRKDSRQELVRSVGCLVTTLLENLERIVFCSSACPVTKTVSSDSDSHVIIVLYTVSYCVCSCHYFVQDTPFYCVQYFTEVHVPRIAGTAMQGDLARWAGLPAVALRALVHPGMRVR